MAGPLLPTTEDRHARTCVKGTRIVDGKYCSVRYVTLLGQSSPEGLKLTSSNILLSHCKHR